MRFRPARALAAAAVVIALAAGRAVAQDAGAAGREWNQERGDAARTGVMDVKPLRFIPRDAWKLDVEGPIVAGPVTWGGLVYTAARINGGLWLESRRLSDGSDAGRFRVGAATEAGLVTCGGTVVLSTNNLLRGYRHVGAVMSTHWSIRHKGPACDPSVVGDYVVWHDGTSLRTVNALTGKESDIRIDVRPPWTIVGREGDRRLLTVMPGSSASLVGTQAMLTSWDFDTGSGRTSTRLATFARASTEGNIAPFYFASAFGGRGGYLVASRHAPFNGMTEDFHGLLYPAIGGSSEGAALHPICFDPVVLGDVALGFDPGGALISLDGTGRFSVIVEAGMLPAGACTGLASAAGDVAYFGNWALDSRTRKILWVRADLSTVRPAIPAGDGRVLIMLGESGLICIEEGGSDGSSGTQRGPLPVATGFDGSIPYAPIPSPMEGPGAVTRDGRFLTGIPTRVAAGRWGLAPGEGKPVPEDEEPLRIGDLSLLVLPEDRVERQGPELAVYRVLRDCARARHAATLDGIFEEAVRKALVEQAQITLEEARGVGLPPVRVEALQRTLSGKREAARPGNGPKEMEALRRSARKDYTDRLAASAAWCARHGLKGAASLLYMEVGGRSWLDPTVDAEVKARLVGPLLPEHFPWAQSERAVERWLAWAPHVVSTEAAFVARDARFLAPYLTPPWNRDTVVLRTGDILFLTRTHDPALVSSCIRAGERAVAILKGLLGQDSIRDIHDEHDLLEVRLHANEDDFRAEEAPGGGFPMPWSAGFYSPGERVSRFYVPDAAKGDPLGRGLREVMAHEITHHFLDVRWKATDARRRGGPAQPGYWCIEGMARFVEDQVCSPTAGAHQADDPTVTSLDVMSQALALGVYFKPSRFLEITREQFATIDTKPKHRVRLLRTLETRILSNLHVFYEQAGATVFFLLHRSGPEHRAAFLRYLAGHYGGDAPSPAWKELGWASADAFDADFVAFLQSLSR